MSHCTSHRSPVRSTSAARSLRARLLLVAAAALVAVGVVDVTASAEVAFARAHSGSTSVGEVQATWGWPRGTHGDHVGAEASV